MLQDIQHHAAGDGDDAGIIIEHTFAAHFETDLFAQLKILHGGNAGSSAFGGDAAGFDQQDFSGEVIFQCDRNEHGFSGTGSGIDDTVSFFLNDRTYFRKETGYREIGKIFQHDDIPFAVQDFFRRASGWASV